MQGLNDNQAQNQVNGRVSVSTASFAAKYRVSAFCDTNTYPKCP